MNMDEFMIYDKALGTKSLTEMKDHIDFTVKLYVPHLLVPCFFDIKK